MFRPEHAGQLTLASDLAAACGWWWVRMGRVSDVVTVAQGQQTHERRVCRIGTLMRCLATLNAAVRRRLGGRVAGGPSLRGECRCPVRFVPPVGTVLSACVWESCVLSVLASQLALANEREAAVLGRCRGADLCAFGAGAAVTGHLTLVRSGAMWLSFLLGCVVCRSGCEVS